jgi:hypothetical protein
MKNVANCNEALEAVDIALSKGSDWDRVAHNFQLLKAARRHEFELSGLGVWLSHHGRSLEDKLDRCQTTSSGTERDKAYVALSRLMEADEMKRVLLVVERAKQLGFSAG